MQIFSIGHSTLEYSEFASRLKRANITAIADVRSAPYSRNYSHFNREELRSLLRGDGISYVFLGKELGGRPAEDRYFTDGVADYEKMAEAEPFRQGLLRVEEGARRHCIALMCSERSPFDCHRCLLVGRALAARGLNVRHITGDRDRLTQQEIEQQLLEFAEMPANDMFTSIEERLAQAYRERSHKVAFSRNRTLNSWNEEFPQLRNL